MRNIYLLSISLLLFSCASETSNLNVLRGNAFGTTYTIQYGDAPSEGLQKGIDSVVDQINQSVSTYLPHSDISKINRGAANIKVDSIFRDVFLLSEEVHQRTNGYFDPTVGVLRNAYGFGDTQPLKMINQETLDSLMRFVGFSKVSLSKDGIITKQYPEIYFDFNAIAKGYGIDRIGRYLDDKGVKNYLIELGGELLAKGQHPVKTKPWIAGVEEVNSALGSRTAKAAVELTNMAMAASGNYRKFRIDSLTGQKFVHTINPLTGSAEKSDVTSATVLAKTCAEADAYATAFMALGLERSKEVLKNSAGIEAYLTYNDSANITQVFTTQGFQKLIVSEASVSE